MNILLLGAAGQVGRALAPRLALRGDLTAVTRAEVDLADLGAVRRLLETREPRLVVNAAAYNEVDRAESEPDAARRLNTELPELLGRYARDAGAALVHYSTDFVFDGDKGAPYVESDPPSPLSAYGRSKLEGELCLLEGGLPAIVLRTAWVYTLWRRSFVSVMLRLAREREELSVVGDQVGSPTFADDLARATDEVCAALGADPGARARELRGVYHAAGGGDASRHELATAVLEGDPRRSEHRARVIHAVTSAAFPTPARRPRAAALDSSRLRETFGVSLLPWRDAVALAFAQGGEPPRGG